MALEASWMQTRQGQEVRQAFTTARNPLSKLQLLPVSNLETEYQAVNESFTGFIFQKISIAMQASQVNLALAVQILLSGVGDVNAYIKYIKSDMAGREYTPRMLQLVGQLRSLENTLFGKIRSLLGTNVTDRELRALISDSSATQSTDKRGAIFDQLKAQGLGRNMNLKSTAFPENEHQLIKAGLEVNPREKTGLQKTALAKINQDVDRLLQEAAALLSGTSDAAAIATATQLLEKADALSTIAGLSSTNSLGQYAARITELKTSLKQLAR